MDIKDIFSYAVNHHASDIHFAVGYHPMIRVDGLLKEIRDPGIISRDEMNRMARDIVSDVRWKEFLEKKDLDFAFHIHGLSRFRVNLHFEKGNVGLVARIVSSKVPTMEEINMPEIVYELLKEKQGLILVTGPSGCGKSTSLAAMIQQINENRNAHIITLEDPIEFIYTSKESIIKQRQLGEDMSSFAEGLKHVLRQDPNVILVGEMRDLETIAATITIAETGHLVLATLHTFNASQTIDRIIDVFPPYQQNQVRLQLSFFLKAVISQQLLPMIGGGRIAAREILLNSPAVANLIRENKIAQIRTVIQTSGELGMTSMDQALKELYGRRKIEKEIARAYLSNPGLLR